MGRRGRGMGGRGRSGGFSGGRRGGALDPALVDRVVAEVEAAVVVGTEQVVQVAEVVVVVFYHLSLLPFLASYS